MTFASAEKQNPTNLSTVVVRVNRQGSLARPFTSPAPPHIIQATCILESATFM